jgi:hypothetical protein
LNIRKLVMAFVVGAVALVGRGAPAQSPATFPVIVVLAVGAPAVGGDFDRGVAGAVRDLETRHGFVADHVYSTVLQGFAARLTARQIAALESDPRVAYVEADGIVTTQPRTPPRGVNRIDAD